MAIKIKNRTFIGFGDVINIFYFLDVIILFSAELAFCGEVFDLTFVLQYFRFIPEIEEIKFFLQVGYEVCFVFKVLWHLDYCICVSFSVSIRFASSYTSIFIG